MKRKTRKILLSIFLTVSTVCFATACDTGSIAALKDKALSLFGSQSSEDPQTTATFNGWTDGTDGASYGATYQTETVALADDGTPYPITSATVKNSTGAEVELQYGKFPVTDSQGYTVEYLLKVGEKTYQRKVAVTVSVAPPMLSLQSAEKNKEGEIIGYVAADTDVIGYKDYPYEIPKCTVTDYVDGEIAEYTVELYKMTETGDEKQDVDLTSGAFTPSETGEYYLLFTSTNSGNATATKKVELTVTLSTPTLKLSDTEAVWFKDYAYTIPTCKVTDTVDGEYAEYTVEAYKVTGTNYELQNVDLTSGTFTPTETGNYLFLYSAVNSHGVTATARAKLTAEDRADYNEFFDTVGTEIVNVVKVEEDPSTETIEARNDWEKINYNGKTAQTAYIAAGEAEISTFTGGYTGNAVRYNCTHGYAGAFRVNNSYTEAELLVLAEKYTHVSVWMAYNAVAEETANTAKPICYGTWGGLLNNAENGNVGNMTPNGSGVWKKYLIKIDKFVELTLAKGGDYAELFQTDILQLDRSKSFIYVGDISFEYIAPTILTVDKDTAAKIVLGTAKGTYVAAGADEIKDFGGDYTGNAAVMSYTSGSQSYALNSNYTADDVREIAEKYDYTHVSMWFAYSTTAESGNIHLSPSQANFIRKKVNSWTGITTKNEWVKYSITIEEYVSLLTNNSPVLIRVCCCTTAEKTGAAYNGATVKLYFGDIVFETIAE